MERLTALGEAVHVADAVNDHDHDHDHVYVYVDVIVDVDVNGDGDGDGDGFPHATSGTRTCSNQRRTEESSSSLRVLGKLSKNARP